MITTPIIRPITRKITQTITGAHQGGAPNPLVWHAAYPDSSGVMQAQINGVGSPTFTNSALLLPDQEGKYVEIEADSPTWHGARKVTNLGINTEDLSQSNWIKAGVTLSAAQPDPLGGATAWLVEATGGGNDSLRDGLSTSGSAIQTFTNSIWLRRGVGSGVIQCANPNGAYLAVSVTANWQRFSITGLGLSETANYLGIRVVTAGDSVFMWHPQAEPVNGQTNQAPGEYIPTTTTAASKFFGTVNGNTVTDNVVTEAVGGPLPVLPSLYAAPALTNSILNSNNLAVGWDMPFNDLTPTLNQVGITGEPNTATLLTCATASSLGVIASAGEAITANTGEATTRFTIKKDETDNVLNLAMNIAKSSSYRLSVWLNKTTGVLSLGDADMAVYSYETVDSGDFWVVYLSITNQWDFSTIDHSIGVGYTDAYARTIDSAVVANIEYFEDKTIAEVRGAGPIITEGASVTTSAVAISYDIANHSNTQGAYYAEYTPLSLGNYRDGILLVGAFGGQILYHNTTIAIRGYDGTSQAAAAATLTSGQSYKVGNAYGAAALLYEVTADGVSAEAAYDGAWSTGFTAIMPLSGEASISRNNGVALIRNIRRYDLPYAAAKAKIDELML